jgi:ABC-type glycerol-3-phosphate transport system substrate-binding protein
MKSFWVVAAAVAALGAAGCADQFRAQPPRMLVQQQEPVRHGSLRLRVAALPPDLAWISDGIRLFEAAESGVSVQILGLPAAAIAGASGEAPVATASMTPGGVSLPTKPGPRSSSATADLEIVSLPLTADQAGTLTPVPPEVEAAVGPSLLPQALRAAVQSGRSAALPVSARWLALAWNPSRLSDSAAPVPPHLEAWVDQLRAMRHSQPTHPPVMVAWDEQEIAGSFALLLAAHGGRLLDDVGYPAFTSPEGEAAVELMIRMLEERLVQPTALETDSQRLAATLTGPYAYWLCTSDALSAVEAGQERPLSLRLSGLPVTRAQYRYPDNITAALVQFRAIAVRRDSERPAAAWRLARFLADPVVLRSSPAAVSVLAAAPASESPLVRQSRALIGQPGAVPWPGAPGLNEALGRFLHAALRRILTPREALERAALQFRQPGALPEASGEGVAGSQDSEGYPAGRGSEGRNDNMPAVTDRPRGSPTTQPVPQTPPDGTPPAGGAAPSGAPPGYPGRETAPSGSDSGGPGSAQGLRSAPGSP